MAITLSTNIDANTCTTCTNRRPWKDTVAAVEAQLKAHRVTWPNFVIMHGKDLSCAAAKARGGSHDTGLYVVATDRGGQEARSAEVFRRKDGHYVGVRSVLNGSAF